VERLKRLKRPKGLKRQKGRRAEGQKSRMKHKLRLCVSARNKLGGFKALECSRGPRGGRAE